MSPVPPHARRIGHGLLLAVLLMLAAAPAAFAAVSPCDPSPPLGQALSAVPQGQVPAVDGASDIAEVQDDAAHGDGFALETIDLPRLVADLGSTAPPAIAVHRLPAGRVSVPRLKPPVT